MSKTIAEQISARLRNDGQRWKTDDGVTFEELMKEHNARCEHNGELDRYVFKDRSALVVGVGCWDLEGKTPFSWKGLERYR